MEAKKAGGVWVGASERWCGTVVPMSGERILEAKAEGSGGDPSEAGWLSK